MIAQVPPPQKTRPAARVLAPLDGLRWRILKAGGPVTRYFVRHRSARVACLGGLVVASALAGTLAAPFWLLALGPVVLGMPHLMADLRYLVVRPGLHRQKLLWVAVAVPLVVAGCGWQPMAWGLAACAGMVLCTPGAWLRKSLVLAGIGALGWLAWLAGAAALLVFVHLHNFIAVLLWWLWRPQRSGAAALVVVVFVLASVALLTGTLAPAAAAWAWHPAALGAADHLAALAPGMNDPWATRWVLLFAFAQAVHYGIWLRLIPEDDRPQPSTRTFAATFRALTADFGTTMFWILAALAVAIAAWATIDLAAARSGYLRLALFHGYLELAVLIRIMVQGGRALGSPA